MLKYLSIKNLILIQHIEINFKWTGFTGETGAGKSMILDSYPLFVGRTKSSINQKKEREL